MYLKCVDFKSGVKIQKCDKYTMDNNNGVKVVATRKFEKKEILHCLLGAIKKIDQKEELRLKNNKLDFSVMFSKRSKSHVLLLGPIAFVNHDCNSNCVFKSISNTVVTLVALKDINPQEEILTFYGTDYFGLQNISCECLTCKTERKEYFFAQLGNIFI